MNGFVDDVRIYNRALSANEVKSLYDFESKNPLARPRRVLTPKPKKSKRIDLPVDLSTVVIDGKWYSPETGSTLFFKQQNQSVDVILVKGRSVTDLTGRLSRNATNLNAEKWTFIVRGDPKQIRRNGTFLGIITAPDYIKAEITWLEIDEDGSEVSRRTRKVSYKKVRE